MKQRLSVVFALIGAPLLACGDPSSPVPGNGLSAGTYQLTMTGDRTLSRSGARALARNVNGGVAILLGTNPEYVGPDTATAIYLHVPPGLSEGAHPISAFDASSENAAILYFSNSQGIDRRFESVANAGSLIITRKTQTGVEGDFAFDAAGYQVANDPGPIEHVHIAGRFSATY